MKTKPCLILALQVLLLTLLPQLSNLHAQGTAITYQGRLNAGGIPANGNYDLRFKLFLDPLGNNQVGSALLTNGMPVASGLFTVALDFGAGIFNGSNCWLEVDVKTNGAASYANLSPLQAVTPAPYSIFAENVGGLSAGTYGSVVTFNNAANQFSGTFTGNGAGLTNANAATLGGLSATGFWQTSGNAGTTPGTNFLGTTDNQPLEVWINRSRVLRLEPGTNTISAIGAPNVIGGAPNNVADTGIMGATIAGGGALNMTGFLPGPSSNHVSAIFGAIGGGRLNTVGADHGTIAGGLDNIIQSFAYDSAIGGGYGHLISSNSTGAVIGGGHNNTVGLNSYEATVGGGFFNSASNAYTTVGGGDFNKASGQNATVGGGYQNSASSQNATVGGGYQNSASGTYSTAAGGVFNNASAPYATVGGGYGNNSIGYSYSTVSGGYNNTANGNATTVCGGTLNTAGGFGLGSFATVGGGTLNIATATYTTVGGGYSNSASYVSATVGGGYQNSATNDSATVGGGISNQATGAGSVVSGGIQNIASAYAATVGGGKSNNAASTDATVSGGTNNAATGDGSTVGGGYNNIATLNYATVSGGYGNTASGADATVPGGSENTAAGIASFAAGSGAQALHNGSFVWSDGTFYSSTTTNQFAVHAAGGVLLAADVQLSGGAAYHNLSLSGGNALGYLYGSFLNWGDGIHLGYNYYADADGTGHVFNSGGATSRISVGYGSIDLAIGGVDTAPGSVILHVDASGVCTPSGTINVCSDRNAKQEFAGVSSSEILRKVAQLSVSEWSYKADTRTRHIGPVAQDFYATFNLGTDDKHIAPMDESGVALAAIQGLDEKLNEKDAEIQQLKQNIAQLQELVSQLAKNQFK